MTCEKTKRFFAKAKFITLEIFDYHQKIFQCCLGIKHSSFPKRNSLIFERLLILHAAQHFQGVVSQPRSALWKKHQLASGHNVSGDGERKRPCSELVKIVPKPRRAKARVPAVDTACVADWMEDGSESWG